MDRDNEDIGYEAGAGGPVEVVVPSEFESERIDKFLALSLELDLSRSYIQRLIRDGCITVNGEPVKANHRVKTDEEVRIVLPEPERLEFLPRDIPLDIVYQDADLAVINKQPGLVVHPGAGNWDNTLVNALLYHLSDLSSIGGVHRPGIVHRLDKDTSGLMVVCKNDRAHRFLVEEFSSRRIVKKYAAVSVGKPRLDHGFIELPIGRHRKYGHKMTVTESGKEARTEYRVRKVWNSSRGVFTLFDITLHTGRTHQIRVHLSALGNPIVGDPLYSKKWEKYRLRYLLLAATDLCFKHPGDGRMMEFHADLPLHMKEFLERLDREE